MNKLIYYLSILLFSNGIAIYIKELGFNVSFIMSCIVVYLITFLLSKDINNSFKFSFYNIISIFFIIFLTNLVFKYRNEIDLILTIKTLILFFTLIFSQKYLTKTK